MNQQKVRRALSIRQPYAEQILRGIMTQEYRSRPTRVRERVYIYASLTPGERHDFAKMHARPGDFPTGVVVGTVELYDCAGKPGDYSWCLRNAKRLARPRVPQNHPQPVWFYPFKR